MLPSFGEMSICIVNGLGNELIFPFFFFFFFGGGGGGPGGGLCC